MSEGSFRAYLAHGSRKISVLSFSPTSGKMVQLQDVVVNGDDVPEDVRAGRFMALAVSPDRRFLYATNRTAPYSFRSFAIDGTDGTLTYLGDAPAVESSPYITTDRTGRFLLAAYNPPDRRRRTGFVSVSAINNGFIQPPHQVIHTPPKTHGILPDASNRFVLAPACDGDVLVRFTFDEATGLLNPNELAPIVVRPESGPRHFVFHASNRYLYMLNEYDGSVYAYSFDPRDGAMSEIQIASVRPAEVDKDVNPRAGDLRITPDGKWLYAAVRVNCTIAAFAVDQITGRLTPAGHFPVDKEPRGFNIDPFGRYLIANGLMTNTAVTYEIDQNTGALTRVAETPTMEDPNWIEFVRLP
ncbi:6-phosphogluconolactonase [Rhodococcus wratislaviensis]|uniref:3-carboxymuconate cyclase n=1 Tax=Rhodococcus wratislaviensis TaxID=44752 RepID=A0AB38FDR3_RHOWR|nr:beta-propeller fold lactonase family protein [Rhodococcus wratislaviensis]REE75490.1 6-phosphogluconolactonase [Rhodococcus wratislaviensis]SPZ39475.1 3-carboxymuconate cyclase [Rhodococcus wratislaviensis]